MKELFKQGKWGIVKVGAILSTLSALISDIIEPACKATLICLCVALVLTLLIWLVHKLGAIIPILGTFNKWLAEKSDGTWYLPVFFAALLACGVFTVMYALNYNEPDGYLAQHSQAVKKLQEDTGLIKIQLAKISRNMERTASAAGDTSSALKEGIGSATEINEYLTNIINPGDARAALAIRGRRFDANGFAASIYQGDSEDVDLFLKAGMKASAKSSTGDLPLYRAVLENMPNSRDYAAAFISAEKMSPEQRVNPVATQGYMSEAIKQFGKWLDNETEFFAYFIPSFVNELSQLNLGDCVALGEFIPQKESLKLIHDYKLDMNSGVLLREKLAQAYEDYLEDSEKKFGKLLEGIDNEYLYTRDYYQCKTPSVKVGDIPQIDQFPEIESGYLNSSFLNPYTGLGFLEHAELDERGNCPDFDLAEDDKRYVEYKESFEKRINDYNLSSIRNRLQAYKTGTEILRQAGTTDPQDIKQIAGIAKYEPAGLGMSRKFEQRPDFSGKIGQAYLPPLQPGLIRIYGPLNSVGVYDDYNNAMRKGSSWTKSVFGRLGNIDGEDSSESDENAWFYADIDMKNGQVVNCRFYANGGYIEKVASRQITDLVNENDQFPSEILKNHFALILKDDGQSAEFYGFGTVIISGDTNLLKARNGQKVRVRYVAGDKEVKRFANMLYGIEDESPSSRMFEFLESSPGDFGYGEATIERND